MKQENRRKNAKKYRRFPLLGRNSYDFITKIKMRSKPFDLPLYHPYAMAIYLFEPIQPVFV